MRFRAAVNVAAMNLGRNRLFLFASFLGVAFGAAVLVFFVGLGIGVKTQVETRLFDTLPETRLKVSASTLDLGLFNLAKPSFLNGARLGDPLLEELAKRPGVTNVYGETAINFPIQVTGTLFGRRVGSDLVATGLAPDVIAPELDNPRAFAERKEGEAVPVVVSRRMLDLYNSAFAPMNGLPTLKAKSIIGFRFDLVLGKSYIGGRSERGKVRRVQCELVGFSKKAVGIGVTFPLGYVKRWNAEFSGKGDFFSAIFVDAGSPKLVGEIKAELEGRGCKVETARDGASRKAREAISFVTGLFVLIAALILALAALNLAFLLFLMVQRRTEEIGLWRTLGATRTEMAAMIFIEASAVGLLGGIIGSGLGFAVASLVENALLSQLESTPFAVGSLFVFPYWLWALSLSTSLAFTLLGALFPAIRAATLDPVRAMAKN